MSMLSGAGDHMSDFQFELYPYEKSITHSVVINSNQVEYYWYLKIPNEYANHINLYDAKKCDSTLDELDSQVDLSKVYRECCRPWLRVETSILDMHAGFHTYKFSFIDTITTDVISLYISYRIQNDNPDKPYIYMNRRDDVT